MRGNYTHSLPETQSASVLKVFLGFVVRVRHIANMRVLLCDCDSHAVDSARHRHTLTPLAFTSIAQSRLDRMPIATDDGLTAMR